MALSAPINPLELPPYSLTPLLSPLFLASSSSSSSRPTSPNHHPHSPTPQATGFARLVSVATGAPHPAGSDLKCTLKSLDASDQKLWLAATDGRVRLYEVNEHTGATVPPVGILSPGSPGRRTPVKQHSVLDFVDEVHPSPSKKPVDRIALLPRLDKAVLLSEGVLSFHTLPLLAPLNTQHFPSIRGVSTFALDEDELAGGGEPNAMKLVIAKRKTVHWLRVTNEGVTSVKDLPLRSGALVSVYRHARLCIADTENYSIVDLEAAEALPLLPISQTPHPDPLPATTSVTGTTTSLAPPGGPDPRQRPAIACVGENEFLIASHTGATTLGVFVTETGEPSRGTVEWASNLRSLAVENQYAIALLHNSTIELHSLHTLEIAQVIQLPSSSPSSSPTSFQPRALIKAWEGIEVGSATGSGKVELVSIPLLPFSTTTTTERTTPPSTPTRRTRTHRPSLSSSSIRSSRTTHTTASRDADTGRPSTTRVLLAARNGVYALTPLTLVVQADALIEKGREADARGLAEGFEESLMKGSGEEGEDGMVRLMRVRAGTKNPELSYVYLRLAYLSLTRTSFQEAFDLFLKSGCDPRLVVRMFPDLRDPLIGVKDEVEVVRGVREEVRRSRTIDDYVLDNLNRNYSPHLQPSVEAASPTIELRASLIMTARDCLLSYLMKWRARRRNGEDEAVVDSRKVDMVVDTTLVRLLSEHSRPADITVLLTGPNDCVLPCIVPSLLSSRLYSLLTNLYLERGETEKTLAVWSGVAEGRYERPREGEEEEGWTEGEVVKRVAELVWRTREKGLTEKWGLWVLKYDAGLGLKLFTDPKQTLTFETRDLFAKMREVDPNAADMFLESTVLLERDTDSRLHADLVKRYIGRLGELLAEPEAKAHLRDQESAYTALASSTSSPPAFLSFLTSRYDPSYPHALLDRVRLKAILFLGSSSKYDLQGAKQELEEMEMRGLRGLVLERVIVYGKLHLDRQALSLLLHTLHDLSSAETYSLQSGDPLCMSDVSTAASKLSLPFKRARKHRSTAKFEEEDRIKESLANLLVEMCLSATNLTASESGEPGETRTVKEEQVARVLETQALHLETLDVLPLLPSSYPLPLLSTYLSRSLRRSLHAHQDASILKSLALAQTLAVSERVFEMQAKMGGTVQLTPSSSSPGNRAAGGGGQGGGEGKRTREKTNVVAVEGKEQHDEAGGEKRLPSVPLDGSVELDLR
ncbi:hypothetical protein JCM11641_002531 [Rhodosporidiobolus odoratus]